MLDIKNIGSKWAGEAPDTIDDLLKMLREQPLDRSFEAYGNFCHKPVWDGVNPYPDINPARLWSFFGNFLSVSYGFTIYTDDSEIVQRLQKAIWNNQRRPDYLSQEAPGIGGRLIRFSCTDVSWNLAKEAHRATSFSPEVRADQAVAGYMDHMAQISWEFVKYVKGRKRPHARQSITTEAEHAAQAEGGEKETIIAGVRVVENFDENRLQLFFDGKPSEDIRARLKSRGFKWAPSQGAWQRQLNNNARSAVKYAITGE
jgi:hypothetical protein